MTAQRAAVKQLRETTHHFEHIRGFVEKTDHDSKQRAGAPARIAIATIRKFPFVMRQVDEPKDHRCAVIIDGATPRRPAPSPM